MIPVSLLLILVAVALLALGLTSGSSGLLIASIAASLLAAIALVIGARRNEGARRAASAASPAARPAAPAEPPADYAAEREPEYATAPAAADYSAAEFSAPPAPDFSAPPAPDFSAPPAPAAAESVTYTEEPMVPAAAPTEEIDFGLEDPPWRTRATPESEVAAATGPDYDRAATAIHGARSDSPDENAWRRDSHAEASAAHAGLNEEFDEPDADDPDDEPLPQAVQPSDAVRVARMDAEVLVVDGRPRYHLADCPHLVGRLTEPIPVNEAVELGFSPCGLCRPVDRLVAAAARH